MESPIQYGCVVKNERVKRRMDTLFSPEVEVPTTQKQSNSSKRSAFKRLQFNFADSPIADSNQNKKISPTKSTSSVDLFDENSCDSGFNDGKSISLDDSMYLIDENTSFSIPEQSDTRTEKDVNVPQPIFDEPIIKKALDDVIDSNERLIGDMSRTHTLPILNKSKHNDLASITPETLSDVLKGKYDIEYLIVDARYPYEFEGGHIQNAENGYLRENLFQKLFENFVPTTKQRVLIFHCEFSSERGPKLMRDLREMDRSINKHSYPSLYYPEIYLLEGGYKDFFNQFDQFCLPKSYLPMLHDNHRNDMKFFRKKSKTWEMETRKRITKLSF
jgi:hypothetical protein